MFKKKPKESKNIIEFNLLEQTINEKLTDIINNNILSVIDKAINKLDSDTDNELDQLREVVKPNPSLEQTYKKCAWEIQEDLNEQISFFAYFSSKVLALKYLKAIKDSIVDELNKKGIITKDDRQKN